MLPPASRCTTSCAAPCAITPARSSRRSSRARSWARPPRPMARCRARARPPCTAATAAPPHPEVLPLLVLSLAAGRAGPPTAPASHRGGRSAHWNGRSLRMTRHHQAAVAALVAVLAAARPVAQQPTEQRRVDSLAAEVRALKARLDSMRAQLIHQPAAELAADTSLAALRAAAAVAAGTDTTKMKADTAGPTKFVGRERSQPQLNPEISATGDVRAGARLDGVQREDFDPREFGVGFQSPLARYGTDPDTSLRTKVGGIDFRFTWRPPAQGLYREWTLRGELYALRKEYSGSGTTRLGWYAGTTYKLGQRLIAGARYDYVEDPLSGLITRQVIPSLTLWESEWVELLAQYTW